MLLLAKAPARDVELVRTLVARVAVAVVPVPVPVVVEAIAVERPLRRRAEPQVVIDLRQVGGVVGRLRRGRHATELVLFAGSHRTIGILADAGARLEAQAPRHVDLPEPAILDVLDGLPHGWAAAVHRADLDHLAVARRRLDHPASFPDGVRRRLLDVDVLSGLQRPDRRQRMPVIRRGDDDGVDVLVVEHAAHVLDEVRLEGRDAGELLVVDARRLEVGVDVAQRLDLDVLQVARSRA